VNFSNRFLFAQPGRNKVSGFICYTRTFLPQEVESLSLAHKSGQACDATWLLNPTPKSRPASADNLFAHESAVLRDPWLGENEEMLRSPAVLLPAAGVIQSSHQPHRWGSLQITVAPATIICNCMNENHLADLSQCSEMRGVKVEWLVSF
jgi:hypothetical protein